MLVQTIVTRNGYFIDSRLRSLEDREFEVDRVVNDIVFYGVETEKEITVIHIDIGDSIFIGRCPFGEQFLVVNISGFHTQHPIQLVGRIHRIADPVDIPYKILVALFHIDVYVDRLVVVRHNTVRKNNSITITQFIVLPYDKFQIGSITLGNKFLGTEKCRQIFTLAGLFHRPTQFTVAQHFIAGKINFMYLDFIFLIDFYIDNHLIFVR